MTLPICERPCCKLTTELPPKLFEAIGRVIVIYSSIEQEVRNIIYSILKISPAEGRVSITNPDTANNLSTIEKLLKINGIEPPSNFKDFKKEMQHLVEIRNWLSHGVWTQIDGKPYLQITHADDWEPNGCGKISRKIVPSVHQVEAEIIESVASSAGVHLESVLVLHKEILEHLQPLPEK